LADSPEKQADSRSESQAAGGGRANAAAADTAIRRNIVPEFALIAGWFIPGLGHFYIGEKRKAMIFFIALMGGFIFGAGVSRLECLSFQEHYYAIIAQLGLGVLTLPVVLYKHFTNTGTTDPFTVNTLMDPGLLYTQVAGLLNFLVALDAYERGIALHSKKDSNNGSRLEYIVVSPDMPCRIVCLHSGAS